MIQNCTAIILAGGNSLRMGQDKATLPVNGTPLLQSVIAVVQPLFEQTLVSVKVPRTEIALPQICDRQTDCGPLAGLVSALEQVSTPWALVVACDMPFLSPDLIVQLAALRGDYQAVVPRISGYPQPLLAFYASSCLPLLRQRLAGGDKSLMGALKLLNLRYVEEGDLSASLLRSFIDLDTPQDVVMAERLWQALRD